MTVSADMAHQEHGGSFLTKYVWSQDHKVIAIPVAVNKRIIKATDFKSLDSDYKSILVILREWFLAYDPGETMEFVGFEDEKAAIAEIKKWQRK